MTTESTDYGPVDVVTVGFEGNHFRGDMAAELMDLVEKGIIRLLDGLFVYRDADGQVGSLEIADLGPDMQPAFVDVDGKLGLGLLDEGDVEIVGNDLKPNSSVLLLVFENSWAARFAAAARAANGQVLEYARIPADAVTAAMSQLR
jgi:hypothetical protein